MYTSLILPHLNYGITLWGKSSQRLFTLQKKALRILTNSKYNAHTKPIFKKESLLCLNDMFTLSCIKIYHKIVNRKIPEYFLSFIETNRIHQYNTRQTGIIIHRTNTYSAEHRLKFFLPTIINHLPNSITDKAYTHSIKGFSNYFKTITIQAYQSDCTVYRCYICNN